MNTLAYEFSAGQRRVLDRYTAFLGSLVPTFNNIAVVFERCRASGHAPAVLTSDSRLNNARFNERYLQEFWEWTDEARDLCRAYVSDLTVFTHETRDISQSTSRSELLEQVDFKLYSLSASPTWKLSPATDVRGLIQELTLRFYSLRAVIQQLKYPIAEVHDESFGLHSVFVRAMDHRICQCHAEPTIVPELFRDTRTVPVWDITYSSWNAVVRAAEYKADVARLFHGLASVSAQISVFIEETVLRIDTAINELLKAQRVSTLRELNFQLAGIKEGADEFMAMVDHLETWLRK
jgi:hypothetical protein